MPGTRNGTYYTPVRYLFNVLPHLDARALKQRITVVA
jgi:hypothetical protein